MVYNGKPIKMDDLGVPLFSETSINLWGNHQLRKLQAHQLCPYVLPSALYTSSCHPSLAHPECFSGAPRPMELGRGGNGV